MTLATAYRNKIDALWLDFHSGGITNPITVIEQISYLMGTAGRHERPVLRNPRRRQFLSSGRARRRGKKNSTASYFVAC